MAEELQYRVLNPQLRANAIRDRLAVLENEHYRLVVAMEALTGSQPANAGDVTREAQLRSAIEKLQKKLDEVESG